ncbi:MAG: hypothetical protein P8I74_05810, partial [Phycisphaerales bacterium]|nr:hypothetical protein [Phycisphaerales bacterium]
EALAGAVRKLSAMDASELESMGVRGRSYVMEHHDLEMLAGRVGDALHEVVGPIGAEATASL